MRSRGAVGRHDAASAPTTATESATLEVAAAGSLRVHHIVTLAHLLSKGAGHSYIDITTTALGRGINRSQQSASRHLLDLERDGLVERGAAIVAGGGKRTSIRVTRRGFEEIERLSFILQNSMRLADLGRLAPVRLAGVLVSGMGEGAYYMALDGYTRQFRSKIGYVPFPGTLNIRLQNRAYKEAVRRLKSERVGEAIEPFSDGRRTYGWAKCFPAVLRAGGDDGGNGAEGGAPDAAKASHAAATNAAASATAAVTTPAQAAAEGIMCALIVLERTHHDDSIIELISEVCLRDAASISDGSAVTVDILPDGAR